MMRPKYHPNFFKYKKSPPIELVLKVISESGLNEAQFEVTNGMYSRCIKHVKNKFRKVPVQHWHLFYNPGEPPPTFIWMLHEMQKLKEVANSRNLPTKKELNGLLKKKTRPKKRTKKPRIQKTDVKIHSQLQGFICPD